MRLTLRDGLLLVPVTVTHRRREIHVPDMVVDTGSATTMLSADIVAQIGIIPEHQDVLHVIHGIGRTEVVFSRFVERLQVGPQAIAPFEIEVGGIDDAFGINGVLGTDFLLRTGAIIDLSTRRLDFAQDTTGR